MNTTNPATGPHATATRLHAEATAAHPPADASRGSGYARGHCDGYHAGFLAGQRMRLGQVWPDGGRERVVAQLVDWLMSSPAAGCSTDIEGDGRALQAQGPQQVQSLAEHLADEIERQRR